MRKLLRNLKNIKTTRIKLLTIELQQLTKKVIIADCSTVLSSVSSRANLSTERKNAGNLAGRSQIHLKKGKNQYLTYLTNIPNLNEMLLKRRLPARLKSFHGIFH